MDTLADAGTPRLDIPLHVLAQTYAAYHGLDPAHTVQYAAKIAGRLDASVAGNDGEQHMLNVAGVMIVTMKLENARVMARLRKPDGSTSYHS